MPKKQFGHDSYSSLLFHFVLDPDLPRTESCILASFHPWVTGTPKLEDDGGPSKVSVHPLAEK